MRKGLWRSVVRNTVALLAGMTIPSSLAWAAEPQAPSSPGPRTVQGDTAVRSVGQTIPNPAPKPVLRTPASFTPEMPLSEAVDILRNCTTPPLNIVVLWRSLDGAGIYRDTPIGLDGMAGLRVRQYLDMLANSLSAGSTDKVGYTVQGGVVTLGTVAALPAPRFDTRGYDIRDLTAPPANYGLPIMGFGGMYAHPTMGTGGYGMGGSSMPGGSYTPSGIQGLIGSASGATRSRVAGNPRGR